MNHPLLFDRYELAAVSAFPSHLNLRGAFGITYKVNKNHWVSKTIGWAQRRHNAHGKTKHDVHAIHAFILLGQTQVTLDEKTLGLIQNIYNIAIQILNHLLDMEMGLYQTINLENPHKFLVAHSNLGGCLTEKLNYLDPHTGEGKEKPKLFLYIPKNPALKEAFAKRAEATCVNKGKPQHRFSYWNLVKTAWAKQTLPKKPSSNQMRRCAQAVADLFMGQHFKDEKGQNLAFYCVGFNLLTFQACLLTEALTPEEKSKLHQLGSRKKRVQYLFEKIRHHNPHNLFSNTFWKNKLCHLNTHNTSTAHVKTILDLYSEKAKF